MAVSDLLIACMAAFAAGFIDAIVGGGGLVQTPVLLIIFPQYPVATILGTTKIPSFCGTSVSALHYSRRVKIRWDLVTWIALTAFASAMFGSFLVTQIENKAIKPIILVALIVVALIIYQKKSLGQKQKEVDYKLALKRGIMAGLLLGFYDGFIGPGAGSFLVLAFITLIGYDFMQASANAKVVNLATNLASILFFGITGHILFILAIPMAFCNMAGGYLGTKMALLKGNKFIRFFFLSVVAATIIRFAYDIFFN